MLHSTRDAAARLGVTKRQVNRLVHSGGIVADRIGGNVLISDRALTAARRSASRGRRWTGLTARAATELIEHGTTTALTGTELSRLKQRLRAATAAELAYQLLADRASLWRATTGTGAAVESALAEQLGLAASGGLSVEATPDPKRRARELRLVEDTEGDVLLVEADPDARLTSEALGLYAFGGTRESTAAAAWLRDRLEQL